MDRDLRITDPEQQRRRRLEPLIISPAARPIADLNLAACLDEPWKRAPGDLALAAVGLGQKYVGGAQPGIQFSRDRVPVLPADAGLRALHDGRGDFEVATEVYNAPSLASDARLRSTPQR